VHAPGLRRYFVLTRKGLHYYVRKQDAADTSARRDLFGEHEGSIALGNIQCVDPVSDEYKRNLTFLVVSKGGGRKFALRASTAELYHRWLSTLQAVLDPQHSASRSGSGSHSRLGSSVRTSSSFPRIPTLLDFRSPPRTDNLANVTLFSSSLGLEVRRPPPGGGAPPIKETERTQVQQATKAEQQPRA
jgi:hypothetical protein